MLLKFLGVGGGRAVWPAGASVAPQLESGVSSDVRGLVAMFDSDSDHVSDSDPNSIGLGGPGSFPLNVIPNHKGPGGQPGPVSTYSPALLDFKLNWPHSIGHTQWQWQHLRSVVLVVSTKGDSPATTGLPERMRKPQGRDR
jgi:hypothetical protein